MNKKIILCNIVVAVVLLCISVLTSNWLFALPVIIEVVAFLAIFFGWNAFGYKIVSKVKVVFNNLKTTGINPVKVFNLLKVVGVLVITTFILFKCSSGCGSSKKSLDVETSGDYEFTTTTTAATTTATTTTAATTTSTTTAAETSSNKEETTKAVVNGGRVTKPSSYYGGVNVTPSTEAGVIPSTPVEDIGGKTETVNQGNSGAGIEKNTTRKETGKQEATTPSKSEKNDGTVKPSNPFEGETTKQPETTKPVETTPPVETTKPEETTTKPKMPEVVVDPDLVVAETSITYTSGAGAANVLVKLTRKINASFRVTWYNDPAEYQITKNNDGSYSLKVTVPSNYKGKLIVTVFDEKGNEIGEKSKIINNM